jgi:hypothetical protein
MTVDTIAGRDTAGRPVISRAVSTITGDRPPHARRPPKRNRAGRYLTLPFPARWLPRVTSAVQLCGFCCKLSAQQLNSSASSIR